MLGSEQKYATFSSIGEFQWNKHQRNVYNNKYQIETVLNYDKKLFRSRTENNDGIGVKKKTFRSRSQKIRLRRALSQVGILLIGKKTILKRKN